MRSVSASSVQIRCVLLTVSLLCGSLLGCGASEEPPASFVARVGDHYLTPSELDRLLTDMGPVPDSSNARQQVTEQWVRRTLLLREAKRLNLAEKPEVRRKLRERRQSTLVTAMTNRVYDQAEQTPTDEDVRTYFQNHKAQLTLREPYVRVRHLAAEGADSAREARRRLRRAREATVDSVWTRLVRRHARTPARAEKISDRFVPESRLFTQLPYVQDELSSLRDGEVAPVTKDDDQYHVLQLVRRIPEGTEPKLRWVEGEIRRRLRIRSRKQTYAREVQRLRNRAKANDLIETP